MRNSSGFRVKQTACLSGFGLGLLHSARFGPEIVAAEVEIGPRETFKVSEGGDGTIALQVSDGELYLSVPPGNGAVVTASADRVGTNESLVLELRSFADGASAVHGCCGPRTIDAGQA